MDQSWSQTYGDGSSPVQNSSSGSFGSGTKTTNGSITFGGTGNPTETTTFPENIETVGYYPGRSGPGSTYSPTGGVGPSAPSVYGGGQQQQSSDGPLLGADGNPIRLVSTDPNAAIGAAAGATTRPSGGSSISTTHRDNTFSGDVAATSLRNTLNAIIARVGGQHGSISELTFYGHGSPGSMSTGIALDPALGIRRHPDGTPYVDALAITGLLQLGADGNLSPQTVEFLTALKPYLAEGAAIYFYGCSVGVGTVGRSFLQQVADLLGCRAIGYDNAVGVNGMRIPFYSDRVIAFPPGYFSFMFGGPDFIGD